jgi:hypothetical protein
MIDIQINKIVEHIKNHYDIPLPIKCTHLRRSYNDHYLIHSNNSTFAAQIRQVSLDITG